jgi:beta-galactosidase
MKKVMNIVPALLLLVVAGFCNSCERSVRETAPVSFNDNWLFIRQDSANIDKILPGIIPNHKWENVSLPHTAFIEPLVVTEQQWTGICWYKKLYRADRKQRHKHTGLLFDGAMNDAIVYLNGAEIARHTGGYLPFYVNLTDDLQYGRENEILVKLDNRENKLIPPGKPLDELDFLWYSGLYRNVSLFVTDKLHITSPAESQARLGGGIITATPEVSRESATVTVSVHVRNDDRIPRSFRMKNTLLDAAGLEVATSLSDLTDLDPGAGQRLITRIIVMNPALWSPDMPFLYTIKTELLSDNGAVIDRRETRTGIRSVKITHDKGLLLNGVPVAVTGTNRHQEYPYIGYALSDNANYRDAVRIREAGFNLVRSPRYPPAPSFLDACDELGLMVVEAIPGWQFPGDSLFVDAALRDTRMMCRRDRNHPSVIMWEASLNETVMPYGLLGRLHETVKTELPFGNNYTCSWMDTISDIFSPTWQNENPSELRKNYRKKKPVFICEYGNQEYHDTNAVFRLTEPVNPVPQDTCYGEICAEYEHVMLLQTNNFQEKHNDNMYGPGFGDANWLMFDYNRGCTDDIDDSGIMNIFRLPKFSYWFYMSQAEDNPVCYIASYNLPSSGNTVKVYSNADSVQLFRNDTLIAVQGPDRDAVSVNLKHPPFTFTLPGYAPGTLKATGTRHGAPCATHSVSTAGPPVALRLSVDFSNKPLQADGADVAFVYATLVDSAGNTVITSDSPVEFSVRGNAELIGNNPINAEEGIASILLRAGTNPGKIMIKATSEKAAKAEIMTVIR